MPCREDLLLDEMIDAAEQAIGLVEGRSVADLQQDRVLRDALLWNFAVLGEAAAHVPDEFKRAHPEVDWLHPSQLRNRIVHGYWSIDLEILHATAIELLPDYVAELSTLLARQEQEEGGAPAVGEESGPKASSD